MPIVNEGKAGRLAFHDGKKVVSMWQGGHKIFTYQEKIFFTYTGIVQSLPEEDNRYNGYYVTDGGQSIKYYLYKRDSHWHAPWDERVKRSRLVTKYRTETWTETVGKLSFGGFNGTVVHGDEYHIDFTESVTGGYQRCSVIADGGGLLDESDINRLIAFGRKWHGKKGQASVFAWKSGSILESYRLVSLPITGTSRYIKMEGEGFDVGQRGWSYIRVNKYDQKKSKQVPYYEWEDYWTTVHHDGYYSYTYSDPDCSISQSLPAGYKFASIEMSKEDGSDKQTVAVNAENLTIDRVAEAVQSFFVNHKGQRVKMVVVMEPK